MTCAIDTQLKPKHQIFVEAYRNNGNNGLQAYLKAYPDITNQSTAATNASRLLKRADIKQALQESVDKVKHNLFSDRLKVLNRLERLADKAEADGNYSSATKSIETGAKLAGLHDLSDSPMEKYNQFIVNLVQVVQGDKAVDQLDPVIDVDGQ